MTVTLERLVGMLYERGWTECGASERHVVFGKASTTRLVVVPTGFQQIADGVYRTVLAATEPTAAADAALADIDAVFARQDVDEDPTTAVRAERDAR